MEKKKENKLYVFYFCLLNLNLLILSGLRLQIIFFGQGLWFFGSFICLKSTKDTLNIRKSI